ncbi:integrase family protein [Methylobacterium sp. 4-46]|uniref:tyrosine-type recombinase/integrase n=1 Tax=unclassified Methylobacterium TaxID=2615210 RepID=UPI000152D02E|nr:MULTISPECIES: tyrosine-type recombinase/integrase [Methylobacterium]ACA15983.1 integrase family protein [Methylobacterium sp. 4-46]WFT81700.1 tyrosine-type recombinase/integrase [Methylobacterium nodulans]
MPLQMARPMRRSGSSFHQLVQRIPADVAAKVRGMRLSIPIGEGEAHLVISDKATDVRTSLRTRDPAVAKARQAVAVAYLEKVWRSVREGPQRLTQRQTVALAGEAYTALKTALEDDPGAPERWLRVEVDNLRAESGQYGRSALMIGSAEEKQARSIEERVGGFSDMVLAKHALNIDADSRARLNQELLAALRQAGLVLMRHAQGDYRPDPDVSRFPDFQTSSSKATAVSLLDLFDGWAKERKPSQSTVDQWRKHCEAFLAFIGKDDAGRVTKADVVAWKDTLVAAGGAPKTINDSKLAALRVAFTWGVENVRVRSNPATGVAVRQKMQAGEQMLGFDDGEAAAILQAAAKETRPYIRWLPLLCAASGARVGEMAQLRAEDVIVQDGIPALCITAEAGSLKNLNSERVIPLHPGVIDAGFLEFVKGKKGPLFYNPVRRRTDAKKPSHKIVAKNVATWVQGLGLQVGRQHRKDPSHAWRHRFKTLARAARIEDSVADAIVGHAPGSVAKAYGTVTLATMHEAVSRIPIPKC